MDETQRRALVASRDPARLGEPALVLGASGRLGGHVYARLCRRLGADAVVGASGPGTRPRALRAVDLADGRAAAALVRHVGPSLVVWCVRVRPGAGKDNEQALSAGGLAGVIAALPAQARLVYVSTDSVLPGARGPYGEASPARRLPPGAEYAGYVNGKIAGERRALLLGARALVVRPGPIFGRDVDGAPDARIAALVDAWRAGRPTARPTNLLRTWIHVADLADTLLAALDRGAAGIVHAGPARGQSHYEVALAVAAAVGADPALVRPSLVCADDARRRSVRLDLRLDTSRARALLGRDALAVGPALAREAREAGRAREGEG